MLFIPFVPQFPKFVEKLVKPKASDLQKKYELKYISTGIQDTAELNILKAKQEIIKMSEITKNMLLTFLDVFNNPNKKAMEKIEKIKEIEELTDQMQEEISKFLVECSKEELSETAVNNVNAMMRIVHELENIGDSCYKLALLTQRRYNKSLKLSPQAIKEINDYAGLILKFIKFYDDNLNQHLHKSDLQTAFQFEEEINANRNFLRKSARKRLQEGSDVKTELLYLDLLKNLEHIGDNALNISQALRQIR
jgi:phosphate:Na+ symporter